MYPSHSLLNNAVHFSTQKNAPKRKEGRFMPDIAQRNSAQQDGAYCKGSVVCNGIQQKHTKAKVKCSDRT
jgi:hypothetical protein